MKAVLQETLSRRAISLAERGAIPDRLVRFGINRLVSSRLRTEQAADPTTREQFWDGAWSGPVVFESDTANEQHYEVPATFFDIVLGPHRKYSAAYWPEDVGDLAAAEEAMLELYSTRADLQNGQSILDLGCGWGSFSLWAGERFPHARITAVSNSNGQRRAIRAEAALRGLSNVEAITADIAEFEPGRRFDRIVSVEMLEHVRNHRELFRRMRHWIEPDGTAFIHVFANRRFAYPFETDGPGSSWMAREFFTGGVMPSRGLLPEAAAPFFALERDWWLSGVHYAKTLDAWLEKLDERRDAAAMALTPMEGAPAALAVQRWRMFFMACSEMFAFDDGREWGVAHHCFRPRA